MIVQPCLIYWNQSVYLIIQPNFTWVVGEIHPLSLEIMPRNQPNKRGRGKSANKDAPAAQKSKTTAEATTASAKGKGDMASTC